MLPLPTLFSYRLPAGALLAANLVVALIVLARGWGYYEIMLVYWCEAVIIGGFNVARMIVVGLAGDPFGKWVDVGNVGARLFLTVVAIGFFIAKFGAFALGMGVLVVYLPEFLSHSRGTGGVDIWHGLRAVGGGVAKAAAVLLASHAISFVMNFLWRGEYRNTNMLGLIFWPYIRMSLVMATLAIGVIAAALVPALDASTTFGIAIVVCKTAADLVMHYAEHARLSRADGAPVLKPNAA